MLPLWNVTPKWLKPALKKILKMKYSWIHKFIYAATFPLIDFDEFIIRIKEMPHMIMQTRNALKTDYWDKDYQDQGMIEVGSDLIKKNITPKTENIDKIRVHKSKTPGIIIDNFLMGMNILLQKLQFKYLISHL